MRREARELMSFWLDKGVDGFRSDVIPFISKDPAFPHSPPEHRGPNSILPTAPACARIWPSRGARCWRPGAR